MPKAEKLTGANRRAEKRRTATPYDRINYAYAMRKNAEEIIRQLETTREMQRWKTPFGMVSVRWGAGLQIMVAARQADYHIVGGGAFSDYADWAKALDAIGKPKATAAKLLHAIQTGAKDTSITDNTARRAAACITACICISEEYRVDGAAKYGRGALRAIAKGAVKSFKAAFSGDHAGFSMAADGGTETTRAIITGHIAPSDLQETIINYISDDSDDEEDGHGG